MADIEEKRGDTRTRVLVLNGDLTGSTTIKWLIARRGALVLTVTPTILDAATGRIEVKFDGTLETAPDYDTEVQVDFPGERVTYPNNRYLTLAIVADLGD